METIPFENCSIPSKYSYIATPSGPRAREGLSTKQKKEKPGSNLPLLVDADNIPRPAKTMWGDTTMNLSCSRCWEMPLSPTKPPRDQRPHWQMETLKTLVGCLLREPKIRKSLLPKAETCGKDQTWPRTNGNENYQEQVDTLSDDGTKPDGKRKDDW